MYHLALKCPRAKEFAAPSSKTIVSINTYDGIDVIGLSVHSSVSSSKVARLRILFRSSNGTKFSMIKALYEKSIFAKTKSSEFEKILSAFFLQKTTINCGSNNFLYPLQNLKKIFNLKSFHAFRKTRKTMEPR